MANRAKQKPSVTLNPVEDVREIVLGAFDQNHKNQKDFMRSVNRVLALATTRGYTNSEQFVEHFRNLNQRPKVTANRLLNHLFEYVSAEEFTSLTRTIGRIRPFEK